MGNEGKTIDINIYLLERNDTPMPDEWGRCIVAAASESEARQLANEESRAEGFIWTDGHLVSAKQIGHAMEDVSGVILISRDMKE